jgi:hypothetical protein
MREEEDDASDYELIDHQILARLFLARAVGVGERVM